MQAFQEILAKKQAEEARTLDWKDVRVAEVKAFMKTHGLTLKDIREPKEPKQKSDKPDLRKTVKIKYRGPNGETWTGRGKQASWLKGLNKEDYKV